MRNFLSALAALLVCASLQAQDFSISTNLLGYANLGTLNLDASYGVARHWTVGAGVRYNPFTFGSGAGEKSYRQRSVAAGARYWPWHIFSGWWLAGKVQAQEYSAGGFASPQTTEGDRLGAGLSGGYTYMLGRHFNIDLGIGVWSGMDRYVVYQCQHCGQVTDSGSKTFFLPNDFLLSLSYIF